MKIITYRNAGGSVSTGVVVDERVLDISAWIAGLALSKDAHEHHALAGIDGASGGIMRWLQSGPAAIEALAAHVRQALANATAPLELFTSVQLYAPVPRPGKIIGVGRNYADHAKETGVAPFEAPRIIFKLSSSVAAPGVAVGDNFHAACRAAASPK